MIRSFKGGVPFTRFAGNVGLDRYGKREDSDENKKPAWTLKSRRL